MTHSNSTSLQTSPSAGQHHRLERYVRALQSFTSLFTVGGLYALAVYTAPVDAVLPGVWATSLGLMHWLSAPVSILIGIHLDSAATGDDGSSVKQDVAQTRPNVRPIAILSSLSYVMFAVAAYAVANGLSFLLRVAICCQALPLGINYVLHCETLVRWFPHRPGFIVGCGLFAYTGGAVILCWLFARLMAVAGVVGALYATAVILTVPSVLAGMLLSFPPVSSPVTTAMAERDTGRDSKCMRGEGGHVNVEEDGQVIGAEGDGCDNIGNVSEATALLRHKGEKMDMISIDLENITSDKMEHHTDSDSDSNSTNTLTSPSLSPVRSKTSSTTSDNVTTTPSAFACGLSSIRFLATQPSFWLYVSTILSTGAPYALLPYFFKLATVYHVTPSLAMRSFQLVGLFGTALALCAGILIDLLASHRHNISGAKRLLIYALLLQLGLFGVLVLGEKNGDGVFVVVAVLVMLTNAHYGCAAVLARDVFGAERAALAFGVGGGLAIGTGEGMSVQIMAFVEQMARSRTRMRSVVESGIVEGVIDSGDVIGLMDRTASSVFSSKIGSLLTMASSSTATVDTFVPTKGTYVPCFVACAVWTVIGMLSVAGMRVRMAEAVADDDRDGQSCTGKE